MVIHTLNLALASLAFPSQGSTQSNLAIESVESHGQSEVSSIKIQPVNRSSIYEVVVTSFLPLTTQYLPKLIGQSLTAILSTVNVELFCRDARRKFLSMHALAGSLLPAVVRGEGWVVRQLPNDYIALTGRLERVLCRDESLSRGR